MKKYKTVITGRMEESHIRQLDGYCEMEYAGWVKTGIIMLQDELIEVLKDAEIAVIGYEKLSSKIINALENLQIIACCRSTPVNIDIDAASRRGIPVLYAPGRNANAVAELTLGLMISAARFIPQAHHKLMCGRFLGPAFTGYGSSTLKSDVIWNDEKDDPHKIFKGFELRGKTLGIIGLGNIGKKVAKLSQAFGMNVIGYDPYCLRQEIESIGVLPCDILELCERSDLISLHCRATKENAGLIDSEKIRRMKSTAVIINTARASLVMEEPLISALKEKKIGGAALDVFWEEPLPALHPLLELDNVVLSPHLGSASCDVNHIQSEMIIRGLLSLFHGKTPYNLANPEIKGGEMICYWRI